MRLPPALLIVALAALSGRALSSPWATPLPTRTPMPTSAPPPPTPTPYPVATPVAPPPTPTSPPAPPTPAPLPSPVPTPGSQPTPLPPPAPTPSGASPWVSLGTGFKSTQVTVRNAPPGARVRLMWVAPGGRLDWSVIPITGPSPWTTMIVGTWPTGTTCQVDLLAADGTVVTTYYGPPVP
jgi:hypothetical protein